MNQPLTATHNQSSQCFELLVDGHRAHLDYQVLADGLLDYHHTFVPNELRGRGVAAILTQAALDYASANGLEVLPSCSYVETFMRRQQKRES